jgi:hypothetical protein
MALDFPSLPYDGQIFVDPTTGSKYVYEAATTKWKSIQHTGVITAFGFDKANAAFSVANAAFGSANNVAPQVTPAFTTANNAYSVANAAFASANNVGPQIAPTFTTANNAYSVANAAFDSANNVGPQIAPTYNTANAACGKANAANVLAYNTGIGANNYTNTVGTAGNNYTNYVGASANSFTNATYVKLTAPNQTITGDLAITGNLSLLGNVTTLLSNNLIINDSLIYLAANNDFSDILDIGFVGNYSNGTANLHTGLFRDHNTKQYFLFNSLAGPEPVTINDIVPYANGMINAVLNADIATSNLILGGANAINWIVSDYAATNAAFGVANAAFASANNVSPQIAPAFNTANAAFGRANTALQNTNVTLAGSLTITSSLGIGTGASGVIGEIRAANNITAYYSDERLKNVISTIQSPLEKINQLSGVIYTNNDVAASFGYTDMSEQVGLLAGQVQNVLPQIVKSAPFDTEFIDGVEVSKSGQNYKTVQYEKLIPLLVEAIKEQQKQIDELWALNLREDK